MGQKVHPFGFRLGVIEKWSSIWYNKKEYISLFHEDLKIREYLKKRLFAAGIARIDVERAGKRIKIYVYTARPGLVIGQKGIELEKIKTEVEILCPEKIVNLQIIEVKLPELNAQLVAENIALQIEKRASFRRAMKRAVESALRAGAKGIRIRVAGRLNGSEIARAEQTHEGSVPLHTLRAWVDYGVATSFTTYGTIGVKVWIYLGDIEHKKFVSGVAGVETVRMTPSRGERSGRPARKAPQNKQTNG